MVIAPDLAVATEHELSHLRGSLETRLEKDKIVDARAWRSRTARSSSSWRTRSRTQALRNLLAEDFDVLRSEEPAPGRVRLALTAAWQREVRERAMLQALEVIRRRVDDPATGIQESVVTRQGDSRILVQIPGVSRGARHLQADRLPRVQDRAGVRGHRERRAAPARATPGRAAGGHRDPVREGPQERQGPRRPTWCPQAPDLTGDSLEDARVQFDSRRSEWQVAFTWNADGGRVFGELTGKNVGKQLAVILDDQVYTAPVVRDRISRQGVITGRFTSQEAADLAVILRAGSLPIPVVLEEERTIGPALGADSIAQGINAALLAGALVVFFMVVYYRLSGVYAVIALAVNLVMLIGLMSVFEATLTLPGIAGLVLTVGMAVDANVIIFERIREELRAGKTPRAAIATGFDKAFWTILDSNITTLITALVLFEYGTGPIKGFAVTLSVGLVTNVFTALVVTRMLYQLYPGHRNVEALSI